jgi:RNA polymerase sigma-70 factor (ECF subfamily)
MSSSFPAAGFLALRFPKEQDATPADSQERVASVEEPSDEALIAKICGEDKEALGLLFRRYARLVHSIGNRILRDTAEAEDFVQELFLHLLRKAYLYDSSRGPARSWIVQTSYYRALHRRNHLATRPHYASSGLDELEDNDVMAPPIAGYDRSGEGLFGRVSWKELIECLTDDQRETLGLHFYEGYTFEEIAERKKQTIVSVRHHFYRGLDRLRKHIFASELRDR